jgi:hypothetical protein
MPCWGRLVETAVGAHLVATHDPRAEVLYWRDRDKEVDFVIERGKQLTAIEVKSGRHGDGLPGMAAFEQSFGPARKLLVGSDGTPLEAFLADEKPAELHAGRPDSIRRAEPPSPRPPCDE